MASITRAALKALRFYKRVVQIVEKFISKCSPEYKISGLYVLDAIVRHSRYYYKDKDVFGPRFLRNLVPLFLSILRSNEKNKSVLTNILYLWYNGGVFPEESIQALYSVVYEPNNDQVIDNGNGLYIYEFLAKTVINTVLRNRSRDHFMKEKSFTEDRCDKNCVNVNNNMVGEGLVLEGATAKTQLVQLQVSDNMNCYFIY